MNFEQHYQEGLEAVELNGATFHCRLPTTDNKRFQRAVMARAVAVDPDTGELTPRDLALDVMAEKQMEAFVHTCIRRVDGWPGYTPEKLLAMVDALEDLWDKVANLTQARQAEADAQAKKPQSTSDGLKHGPDGESSMPPSAIAAG